MISSTLGKSRPDSPIPMSIFSVVWTVRVRLELYTRSKVTPSRSSRSPSSWACPIPLSVRGASKFLPAANPGVALDTDSPCRMK